MNDLAHGYALLNTAKNARRKFELSYIHHVALVCSDMERTVKFYTEVLGFRLVKTTPEGAKRYGQHFFFEFAPDQHIAFFWFPDAPKRIPKVTNPNFGRKHRVTGEMVNRIDGPCAHGTLHHLSFKAPREKLEEYRQALEKAGVKCSAVEKKVHRFKDPETGLTRDVEVFNSLFFADPDGICLEFTCLLQTLGGPLDVIQFPATADGIPDQPPEAALVSHASAD